MSENKSSSWKQKFPALKTHPQWPAAEAILEKLRKQGFEALLAGGAVRDLLLDLVPGDLDIATSAKPDVVEEIFQGQTVAVGKSFGVIRVIMDGHSIEVATYRQDLAYTNGRKPDAVIFTNRVEDAKRRDFTVNALFYDPFTEIVYDDVEGLVDLKNQVLRCVGDAALRFEEDQLRRLRMIRFVSQLGFAVDGKTLKAAETDVEGLKKVSRERVTEEIGKMWKGHFLERAFPLFLQTRIAEQVDPAWKGKTTNDFRKVAEILKSPTAGTTHLAMIAWAHYFSFFYDEDVSAGYLNTSKNDVKPLKTSPRFLEEPTSLSESPTRLSEKPTSLSENQIQISKNPTKLGSHAKHLGNSTKHLGNHTKLFRLPKDTEKFIANVYSAYKDIPEFLKKTKGEQRWQAAQEGFILGFKFYIALKAEKENQDSLSKTLDSIQSSPALPPPLIKAHHIQNQFQGAALGKKLKEIYILQLENNWKSPEEALRWLANNSDR